ncbi:hypothetical protein SDC9_198938 [bioreactor metagenome]|uniref:Uncharacterized protein n=1 Tax=bioreactor metagenome TaxID=1076179 RepID=A0A645IJ26_9ZZZZ
MGLAVHRQALAHSTHIGLDIDESDVVFLGHGMVNRTHVHRDPVSFDGNHRYMLFLGCINSIGLQYDHLFAAARDLRATVDDLGNNVSTMFADVKFLFFHRCSPWHQYTRDFASRTAEFALGKRRGRPSACLAVELKCA